MPKGRKAVVVDTNVPIVANRRSGGSYACASACAKELMALKNSGTLILDSAGLILQEYKNYLNFKGQPGAGDAFLRWFFNNRGKKDLCREVRISAISHEWRQFEEFPDDGALEDFDKSDQKFIAAALSVSGTAPILQAADHKWLKWAPKLASHGVVTRFICQDELETIANRKGA